MPSIVTLKFLSTTQQTNGYTILVKVSSVNGSSTQVAAVNFITFPANNIDGHSTPYTDNSLVNGTYLVGSQNCSLVSYSPSESYYTLNISTADVLPEHSDYYISASVTTTDSVTTEYSDALYSPVSPSTVDLKSAVIARQSPQATTATISVLFDEPDSIPDNSTFVYNVATQILRGDGTYSFTVVEELIYNSVLGGVSYNIVDPSGIDEVYLAVQVVRQIEDPSTPYGQLSTYSELSETIQASDSSVPLPPTFDALVYIPGTNQNVELIWTSNSTDPLTDVTGYSIYYTVGSGTATLLDKVSYTAGQSHYSYNYNLQVGTGPGQIPANSLITYYIVSTNANGNSAPSNSKSITVVVPSSAPLNLSATAIRDSDTTQDISVLFTKPSTVNGGIANAYYIVEYSAQSSPNVPLSTKNVPYDGSATVTVAFNQSPYDGSTYIVKAKLVTTDTNTNTPLVGSTATSSFTSGYAPFIYNINNSGQTGTWNKSTPLVNVQVLTADVLTGNRMEITVYVPPAQGATSGTVTVTSVQAQQPIPFSDPYSSFEGSYIYTFDLSGITNTILSFTVANSSDLTSRHITGPISN